LSPRRSEGERQRGKNLSVDIGNRLGHPTSSRLRSGRRQALKRFIVLFLMEISTRGVEIGGIASKANGLWMAQIARNVTDEIDGFFKGKRYLIHDRDPWYTQGVSEHAGVGIESVRLPPKSPNWNAHAERFVRTIKEECVEQMIFFGEDWLRSGVRNFVEYDHHERNHQGLDNRLVIPMKRTVNTGGRIQRRQRLGGLLNYDCRAASIFCPVIGTSTGCSRSFSSHRRSFRPRAVIST